MQYVGDRPLAVGQREQVLAHAGTVGERVEGADERAPGPGLVRFLKGVENVGIGRPGVTGVDAGFRKSREPGAVDGEQRRGQGGANALEIGRIADCFQDQPHVVGLVGIEQFAGTLQYCGDASRQQLFLEAVRLLVLQHQHGDVTGLHGPAHYCTVVPAVRHGHSFVFKQVVNIGRHPLMDDFRRDIFVANFPQYLQFKRRRIRFAVDVQTVLGLFTGTAGGIVSDPVRRHRKGPAHVTVHHLFRLTEQMVDGLNEQRLGAVVLQQRVPAVPGDLLLRMEIGKDIAVAKGVDRLFGVADQEERLAAVDENAGEDFELHRVRVLEFIDHPDLELVTQQFGKGFGAGGLLGIQRGAQIEQHVIIGPQVLLSLQGAEAFAAAVDQVALELRQGAGQLLAYFVTEAREAGDLRWQLPVYFFLGFNLVDIFGIEVGECLCQLCVGGKGFGRRLGGRLQ